MLRVCEANRIRREHLDFEVDVEIAESILEPAELPRRIFKDNESIEINEAAGAQDYIWHVQRWDTVCKNFWSPSPQWSYIKDNRIIFGNLDPLPSLSAFGTDP